MAVCVLFLYVVFSVDGGGVVLYSAPNGDIIPQDCSLGSTTGPSLNISPPTIHVGEGNLEIGIIGDNSTISLLSPSSIPSSSISSKLIGHTSLGVIHYETALHPSGTSGGMQFLLNQHTAHPYLLR